MSEYNADFVHGRQADDPVPTNESDCCFPCGYHNCMVESCLACEGIVVWNETWWEHLDMPEDGHTHHAGPPEHWDWVLQERARIDGEGGAQ